MSSDDSVDVDALDVGPLSSALDKVAAAAERSAAHPMPDDAMPLRNAANRASIEFVQIIPSTDWAGLAPAPRMGGSPERMSAIATVFRVLKACHVTYPYRPMPPPGWIAAELRAALAELAPTDEGNEPTVVATASAGKLEKALALLSGHPGWSDARIAREVGCSPAYLSKTPRWRMVRKAVKGIGQEDNRQDAKHRGNDMNAYRNDAQQQRGQAMPRCASCGEPAQTDSNGRPLIHEDKPRCTECWADLRGSVG
jgi:hypothetical protein